LALNNQIVYGQGGTGISNGTQQSNSEWERVREMEEEVEGVGHRGDNNAVVSAAMASVEKGSSSNGSHNHQLRGTMVAVFGGGSNGGCPCRRRQSSSTAAMAVFVNGNGKGRYG
jgi:hypothetical protein